MLRGWRRLLLLRYRRKRKRSYLVNTFFTFCRHPDFFMAGLADFGFFFFLVSFFFSTKLTMMKGRSMMNKTLPTRSFYGLRRTSGWYQKAVPEALSFFYCLRTVAKVLGSMRFPLWAILVCTVGNVQFSTNEKRKKKETNQIFL